ncbi:MAG: von Willebrand factor type A domain-containing protein, partial [Deltaproteobacteria bacterium]|nr:von Willebrand factor type A domain-containing protein [Deltaproteobacteria bacterium]
MKQESGHFLVSPYGAEVFEMEVQQAPQWSEHDYREYVGTSFVTTADDPVSTFSIDVDTGAYSLARRSLLQDRRLPMPGGVRVEEMINYFDYAYPEPTGEVPVSITSEVGPCPWDPEHRLVHVG